MKYLLLFITTVILFSCQIKKDYNIKVHTTVFYPNSTYSHLYGVMECDSATMINKNQVIC